MTWAQISVFIGVQVVVAAFTLWLLNRKQKRPR